MRHDRVDAGFRNRISDLKEFISDLGKAPLQYHPGTTWHYSVSVDVQGALIEVLSGQTLDVFLAERIFNPLEMVDTGFYVPAEKMGEKLGELESYRSRPVIVTCQSGVRAGGACNKLKQGGFERLYELSGGLGSWQQAGLPVKKGKGAR